MPTPASKNRSIQLYLSASQPCPYLDNQQSQMLTIDPEIMINQSNYSQLIQMGFRRSGDQLYRPHCKACDECKPIRIELAHFTTSRNQRRILARNHDIQTKIAAPDLNEEQFNLFRHYLAKRHPGGGMENPEFNQSQKFLSSPSLQTHFIEFRLNNILVAVAVTDILDTALSAVYTFFDPDYNQRSLGVFAILWQLDLCRQLDKNWLYLGYWIKNCAKMRYKQNYQPFQLLTQSGWYTQK